MSSALDGRHDLERARFVQLIGPLRGLDYTLSIAHQRPHARRVYAATRGCQSRVFSSMDELEAFLARAIEAEAWRLPRDRQDAVAVSAGVTEPH